MLSAGREFAAGWPSRMSKACLKVAAPWRELRFLTPGYTPAPQAEKGFSMGYSPPLEMFVSSHDRTEIHGYGIDYWSRSERSWVSGVRWRNAGPTSCLFQDGGDGRLQPITMVAEWLSSHAPTAHVDVYKPVIDPLDKLDYEIKPWTVSVKFDRDSDATKFIEFLRSLLGEATRSWARA